MRFTVMEAECKPSQEIDVVGVCEITLEADAVPPNFAEMRVEASSGSLRGLRWEELRILGGDLTARQQNSRTRNSSVCHATIFWITHLSLTFSFSHTSLIRFLFLGVGSATKDRQHLMQMRTSFVDVPLKMSSTSWCSCANLFTVSTISLANAGSSAKRYCVIAGMACTTCLEDDQKEKELT